MAIFPSSAIPSGATDFDIPYSCRFNDGDSPKLTRTPGSASNRRTFTFSAWIKLGATVSAAQRGIFGSYTNGNDTFNIEIEGTGEIGVDEYLTGRENLVFQSRISQIPKEQVKPRIDEVISLVELEEKQNEAAITYSGGMRKRLDIACGLIHRPRVLFLDEPTVGLDIQTRRKIWDYIRKIHKEFEMTLFVSTHYMEEADKLCDRVGIIDYGKIQVIETPEIMKNAMGNDMISFSLIDGIAKQDELVNRIKHIEFVNQVTRKQGEITIKSSKCSEVIPKIFQTTSEMNIEIDSLSLNKPTLDDVFISYTGHNLRDDTTKKLNKRKEFNLNRRRGI